MSVSVQARALTGSKLGQSCTEMTGEGGLGGRDSGGWTLEDLVRVTVCEVGGDGGGVDALDGGVVVGRVSDAMVVEEFGDLWPEGGLEERDSGSGTRVLGDQG